MISSDLTTNFKLKEFSLFHTHPIRIERGSTEFSLTPEIRNTPDKLLQLTNSTMKISWRDPPVKIPQLSLRVNFFNLRHTKHKFVAAQCNDSRGFDWKFSDHWRKFVQKNIVLHLAILHRNSKIARRTTFRVSLLSLENHETKTLT